MNTPSQQLIKDVTALQQKKFREETGQLLVEGRHPIEEAFRAGLKLSHWFALQHAPADSLPQATLPLPAIPVNEKTMRRMSSTDSAPPCLGVFMQPDNQKKLQGQAILLLDGIQDPGNLGTLIRSSVAFGIDSVVLTGDHVEPYNPKVIRASAGLVFALPLIEAPTQEIPSLFAQPDWRIYTTSGSPTAQSYRQADYTAPHVIVLGNEGRGVSPDLFAGQAAEPLTIPMSERVESLNVAVSGAIILAEAAAQRQAAREA